MDNRDVEVLSQTLNSTIQRHSRTVQNYEVEITNLTAELVRTQMELATLKEAAEAKPEAKATPAKS